MPISREEYTKIIRDLAEELSLASHQSKDKEVSGLFKEIKADVRALKTDLAKLELAVVKLENLYSKDILPNLKSWNDVTDNYKDDKKWITRLIGGILLTAVLGLILAKNIGA